MDRRYQFDKTFREIVYKRWADSPLCSILEYALFPGGKRLRPLLCFAVCEDLGGDFGDALGAAAAVECLHIASLIHDDLPCLDDDTLRRGVPTCHMRFGEADALLAGDALLSWAFELGIRGSRAAEAVSLALSRAFADLCAGQLSEIRESEDNGLKIAIYEQKTGALFGASLRLGFLCARGKDEEVEQLLDGIGRDFGVLFQAQDDREDGEGDVFSRSVLEGRWDSIGDAFTSLHDATACEFARTKMILEAIVGWSFS